VLKGTPYSERCRSRVSANYAFWDRCSADHVKSVFTTTRALSVVLLLSWSLATHAQTRELVETHITRLRSDLQVFESMLNSNAATSHTATSAAAGSSSSSSAAYNEQHIAAVHPVALPGDEVAIRPNAAEHLWVLANVQVPIAVLSFYYCCCVNSSYYIISHCCISGTHSCAAFDNHSYV
jgi:hypothetical protein